MEEKTKVEIEIKIQIKPLETGRQIYSWFCTDAIGGPLTKNEVLARQGFRFIFGTSFIIGWGAAVNASLLRNYSSVNGIDELFLEFFQLDLTLYLVSATIATFNCPQLASLFGHLESIYSACKDVQRKFLSICFISINLSLPDPDERLAITNERCERFYGIFIKFMTKWTIELIVLMSAASVFISQLKFGLGHFNAAELFHPVLIM